VSASVIALDVGGRRIGVAVADTVARIAHPLTTLDHSDTVADEIAQLVRDHNARALVVGLPRGLDGQQTAQSEYTQDFAKKLQDKIAVPLYWQDEAVTSKQAEAELKKRGKPYTKGDIDALAATYVLEDFLASGHHDKLNIV
jgi:putative holliday junction resolvase